MDHRNRRRVKRGILAGVVISGLALTGCTAGSGSGKDSGDADKVTNLVIPTNTAPWTPSYKKIIADYEKETGVHITLKTYPFAGLQTQELNDVQNQSHTFDVYQLAEAWTAQFYSNDWVQPLKKIDPSFTWPDKLISYAGIGEWNAQAKRTEAGAKAYGLPVMGIITEFMYRKDVYKKLGLKVPKTWDEVLANGKKAMKAGAIKYGYMVRAKPPSFDFTTYLNSVGGSWFSKDWTPTIDSPDGKKALDLFVDLAKLGPDSPQTMGQAEETALMQGGTVLQAQLVSSVSEALEDPNLSSVAGKIGYAEVPGGTPHSGAWALAVPAGLPKKRAKAAYDFIRWLTSKKAQEKWTEYGGIPTRTDIKTDRPAITVAQKASEDLVAPPRYIFTPKMYQSTDRYLSEAVAGQIPVPEALTKMQSDLTKIVTDEGYLKK